MNIFAIGPTSRPLTFSLALTLPLIVMGVLVSSANRVIAQPPPIQREFRAAWIATVANIDWPSRPGLTSDKQQQELLVLFDKAVEMNLNAVVLQIRPACDALYPSELEPWSEYLTGAMGRPPSDAYDPLQFAIEQAHERGLQLHAWLNPYRASHPTAKSPLSPDHVSNRLPNSVVRYGDYLWLDPSDEAAAEHSLKVVLDVVKRYDVDGIHFDDYFYPYPIDEKPLEQESGEADDQDSAQKKPLGKVPFPDDASWARYIAATPAAKRLSRDDWRRNSINQFIRRVYQEIKREKPAVLFGVSPFGIWRPGHPASIQGFDPYAAIYADSKLWLQEGWVDYFTPQLYWAVRSPGQSYPVLLEWWQRQNSHGRHLWPGNYTSRLPASGNEGWKKQEIIEQIRLTQGARGASGNIHFSIKALAANRDGIVDALKSGPYAEPAVIPASPWLAGDEALPMAPSVKISTAGSDAQLQWHAGDERPVWQWVVQWRVGNAWRTKVLPGHHDAIALEELDGIDHNPELFVTAIDRLGRQSSPATP